MAPISEAKIAKKSSVLALFNQYYVVLLVKLISFNAKTTILSQLTIIMAKKYLKIVFANRAPRFWDVVA